MAISQTPALTAHISFPHSESSYLGRTRFWQIYPLSVMAISQIPALTAHISFLLCKSSTFGRPGLGRSIPPFKWQFHRFLFYSEGSYLTDQVLGNLPPFKWQFHRFLLLLLIFISYSGSSTFGRPGLGISTPFLKWQFHRFLLWLLIFLSHSESSKFGRPGLGRSLPSQMAISQIPALPWEFIFGRPCGGKSAPFIWQFHRFLLWLLIFLSYSKSSTFGMPGLGRSNPSQISISQILALLWELIFGRPGLGRTTPISKGNFTDSCSTLRVHIWQKSVCRSTHPLKWQFHRFLLWMHIFLSYSKSSSFGRPVLCRFTCPNKKQFHRFLLYSESSYLADQVLADLPPSQMAI